MCVCAVVIFEIDTLICASGIHSDFIGRNTANQITRYCFKNHYKQAGDRELSAKTGKEVCDISTSWDILLSRVMNPPVLPHVFFIVLRVKFSASRRLGWGPTLKLPTKQIAHDAN